MVAAVKQPSISLVSQCVAIIRHKPVAWQILRVTSRQKSSTPKGGPLRGGLGPSKPRVQWLVPPKDTKPSSFMVRVLATYVQASPEAKGREAV